MKRIPNLLLVSGAGRNVGKSTLVCRLIEKFKAEMLMAVKISPHFHESIPKNIPYIIEKEINPNRGKDSSRFLKSGAAEVYYLQVHDEHLAEAFDKILGKNINDRPIIAESGGLAKFIQPGLMLFVEGEDSVVKNKPIKEKADKVLQMQNGGFAIDDIEFTNGEWKLKANS